MYCHNCGSELPEGARFCPGCGASSDGSPPRGGADAGTAMMMNRKSEGLAVVLSLLVTGLGQMYVGQVSRGILMLIVAVVLWALAFALLFPGIIVVVLWLYSMYDAYKLAEEYNRYLLENGGQPPWRARTAANTFRLIDLYL